MQLSVTRKIITHGRMPDLSGPISGNYLNHNGNFLNSMEEFDLGVRVMSVITLDGCFIYGIWVEIELGGTS